MNRYGKLLPIGSIVKLKNVDKKIMVTGVLAVGQSDKKIMKDYSGCFFPEGILTGNKLVLFDQEDISEPIYLGYIDSEEKEFKKNINDNMELLKSAVKKYKEDVKHGE